MVTDCGQHSRILMVSGVIVNPRDLLEAGAGYRERWLDLWKPLIRDTGAAREARRALERGMALHH